MKIPLQVDLDIHAFSGAGITEYNSGMTNCIIHKEKKRTTQRPSINITEDGSAITALNNRGRGLYYWENNLKLYIVHDNDVYEASQNTTAVGTISAGTERVTMLETIGTPYLVILDAENDEGWYMNAATTVTKITDAQFPSTLVHGGIILDTYLFVMDEDGIIYNSDVNTPINWSATSFISTERENDKGTYLGKQRNMVIAFNTRTIEVLYNANNSVGSPLNRRQDVSFNIGCASGLSVWEDGDVIFFMGSTPSGQLSVMRMENLQITPVSTDTLDSYFTQAVTIESIIFQFSGTTMMGNRMLIITPYIVSSSGILPSKSLSYDDSTGIWGFINTDLNGHGTFPLMGWTKRTGGQNATVAARTGEGIFSNGDLITVNDRLVPQDTLLGSAVFEAGVFEPGVFTETADSGTNIASVIRSGLQDAGSGYVYKFQSRETVEMESTTVNQSLVIKHSDEDIDNFDSGNAVNTTYDRKTVNRSSRFMRRNYQLEISSSEQVFIKALDVDAKVGI